ncbi:MAG: LamG-like jellyroll fold domain-containing protein, partial [Opitutae bacterium]
DYYDDDIDGDGLTNAEELLYNSDPWDASSSNRPPSDINASNLTIAENSAIGTVIGEFNATDPDGDGNFTYAMHLNSSYPMHFDSLVIWLPFDEANGTTTQNYGSFSTSVSLLNGASFSSSEKKFGASSVRIPLSSDTSQVSLSSPIPLGSIESSNDFSLSVWFKGLYDFNETSSGWRTLTRGSTTSTTNHHVLIENVSDKIGTHKTSWLGTGQTLNPTDSQENWQHLVATFDGFSANFFIDGNFLGSAQKSTGGDIKSVGNQITGGQHFAEYLDDFRVYSKVLTDSEISLLYLSPFSIDSNGSLTAKQTFDYETDARNYSITVRVFDDHNATFDKNFTITVTNVVEDLDGDGTEDHYDEDIDGDGLTNAEELAYNSDPWDASSSNRPPSDINTSSSLTIAENSAIGTVIGEFNATDPDGEGNFTFSLYPLLPSSPSIWLDGVDINGDGQENNFQLDDNISLWVDKSGSGYDFNRTHGQPTYSSKAGLGVVKFDGQSIIWTGKSLYPDFSNYTILSVSRYTGGLNNRVISDVALNNWLFGYWREFSDCFFANGWLTSNRNQVADQNWNLHVGTINDSDYAQGWVNQINMVDNPTGAGSPHQPKLLALGGGRWSTTSGL